MGFVKLFLRRYWSLILAFIVPVIEFCTDSLADEPVFFENPARVVVILCVIYAALTFICLGMVIHSWQLQRRFTKNRWRLVFWTHVLFLPALSTVVLGLHKIQISTYDLSIEREQFQSLNFYTGEVKDRLIWLVPLNVALILIWGVVAIFNRKSGKPAPGLA
jgi:hypothetical protein